MADAPVTVREVERKYELAGGGDPPGLAGAGGVAEETEGTPVVLEAIYYDTDDLRLLGDGVTLRRRSGGEDAGDRARGGESAGLGVDQDQHAEAEHRGAEPDRQRCAVVTHRAGHAERRPVPRDPGARAASWSLARLRARRSQRPVHGGDGGTEQSGQSRRASPAETRRHGGFPSAADGSSFAGDAARSRRGGGPRASAELGPDLEDR